MAFTPQKLNQSDINGGNPYVDKQDSPQADAFNRIIQGVLWNNENSNSGVSTEELDKKLDKVTKASEYYRAYIITPTGEQGTVDMTHTRLPYALVRRGERGEIDCDTPQDDYETANKKYVDDAIAGISGVDVQINGTSITENGVANIPMAGNAILGVMRVGEGLSIDVTTGKVNIFKAKNEEIEAKSSAYRPIVPANLDLAVKVGLTTNNQILDDKEKQSAQAWLGISGGGTLPDGVEMSVSRIALIDYDSNGYEENTLSITPQGIDCEVLDFYHINIGGTAGSPRITLSNDNHTAQTEVNDLLIYKDKIVRETGYLNLETETFDTTKNTYTYPTESGTLATEEWVVAQINALKAELQGK